jgi:parallel beta-helix repeat protein
MARRAILMTLTMVLVSAMLLSGCGGDSEGPSGPTDPACGLDFQSLSFGEVEVGGGLDLTFKITNTGGGTLTGTVSEACGDFTLVGDASYSLAGGDTATITVRFSPTSVGAKACTLGTGASQCPGLPCSGAGVATTPICQVSPTTLAFNVVFIGSFLDRAFTIKNIGVGTLSGSVSESDDNYSLVSGGGGYSLAAGESLVVTVRFTPTSEGTEICSVETGGSCAAVSCYGDGAHEPICDLSVSRLDFGAVAVGEHRDTTFTITNTGGWWLAGYVYTNCDGFSVVDANEYSLGAGESVTFTVRFAPSSIGPEECTILLHSDTCEDIPCTGLGLPGPTCSVDPDTLDFGYLGQGGTADLAFTIRNIGGGTVSGTVSSPCAEFSIVGSAAYSLGYEDSAVFTVRYAPLGAGADVCTIETGSGICTDVVATGGIAPQGDYYVHASSGSDANPGTIQEPFKTITHAVAAAGPNKTVCVMPGTYNAALGESFPIYLQQGQSLVGDVPNKGAGVVRTLVSGSGYAGHLPWADVLAAVVVAEGSYVAGLSIDAPYSVDAFGVYLEDVTGSIAHNTFGSSATTLYGGVCVMGSGASGVVDNDFLTLSYGVYTYYHAGSMTVEGNLFETMAICIDISGSSDSTTVRGNTIIGNGQCGVQVQSGAPVIEGNTFNRPGGYVEYGAVYSGSSGGNPTVRGNVFMCARGVRADYGNPDIGTTGDPGANDFSGVTGAAVYYAGTGSISAIGNTWPNSPPVCGADIVTTGSGSVTWGTGANETCP